MSRHPCPHCGEYIYSGSTHHCLFAKDEHWPPRHHLDDWCTSVQAGMLDRSHHRFRILTTYYLDRCRNGPGLIPQEASDRAGFSPWSAAWHRVSDLDYWNRVKWTGKTKLTKLKKPSRVMQLTNQFWKDCQGYRETTPLLEFLWRTARHDIPPHREEDRVTKAVALWRKMTPEEREQFRQRAKQIPPP
mgnify:FL=1